MNSRMGSAAEAAMAVFNSWWMISESGLGGNSPRWQPAPPLAFALSLTRKPHNLRVGHNKNDDS